VTVLPVPGGAGDQADGASHFGQSITTRFFRQVPEDRLSTRFFRRCLFEVGSILPLAMPLQVVIQPTPITSASAV
jgi:hypothetical protein